MATRGQVTPDRRDQAHDHNPNQGGQPAQGGSTIHHLFNLRLRAYGLLAALLVALTACGGTLELTPTSKTTPYTGETIFTGLFFGQGPAAKLFPEIWQHPEAVRAVARIPAERQAAMRKLPADVVRTVDKLEPGFFDRFGRVMQSGNRPAIMSELANATRLLDAGLNRLGVDPTPPVNDIWCNACWYYTDSVAVAYSYVAGYVAAILNIVVTQIDFTPITGPTNESRLAREQLVEVVATRLRSSPTR